MPLPPFNILTLFFTTSRWLHRIWDRPLLFINREIIYRVFFIVMFYIMLYCFF